MKNKEKFSKEIFDIACKGDSIAVTIANNEIVSSISAIVFTSIKPNQNHVLFLLHILHVLKI